MAFASLTSACSDVIGEVVGMQLDVHAAEQMQLLGPLGGVPSQVHPTSRIWGVASQRGILTENLELVFDGKKRLLPKPSDLSFYNWETQTSTSSPTPNFQVIADSEVGLLFKNKRDRKLVNVDPNAPPSDNTTRTEIETDEYLQVVLYDHITRRRT